MSKEIYISSTPHETRLAIVEKEELTEIYYERENEYTLAGSIYNGRVTRVLPGMQSSFVDIGLERDAFLYITDFMEEAGEAADFDGAAGGGERAPRGERPRSEGRSEGRGDGRGEGRGRGRRDGRDRDRDRGSREPLPESRGAESSVEEPRSYEPVSYAPVDDEALDAAPRVSEEEEIGEGAPGADGSRRWRGRRGRRRGRGVAGEAQGEASAGSQAGNDADEFAVEAVAPREEVVERRPIESRDSGGERSGGERGGRDRGGRDRGGRDRGGRDRGGREQGGREQGSRDQGGRDSRLDSVRERFAPRGARPGSADDEVVDLNAAAGAAAEPFILPGESLSKYRRGESGAATEPSAAKAAGIPVIAKPSTEIAPLVGWDGGAVLPGETLRAREPRGDASRGETSSESRGGGDRGERGGRGRDRRRGRDEQRGRGGERNGAARNDAPQTEYRAEPRGIDPAEAVLPAVSSGHDVAERDYEPHYAGQTDLAPVEALEPVAEHEAEFEEAISELHDAELQEAAELPELELHETTAEYEPEENASASFRVDPAGTREFRQSGGVEEPAAEPELTNLQPTGELISEVAHAEMVQTDPTAPIEHEAVVQSVHAAEAETPVALETERAQGFAPGDGELEEELMEEEDVEIGSLHASAFQDDVEEETLEGAADLGSMIRDMTIDDITRHEPAEIDEEDEDEEDFDDEEDFEEDELASNGDEDFVEEEVSGSQISEAEEEEFAESSSFDENGETRVGHGGW